MIWRSLVEISALGLRSARRTRVRLGRAGLCLVLAATFSLPSSVSLGQASVLWSSGQGVQIPPGKNGLTFGLTINADGEFSVDWIFSGQRDVPRDLSCAKHVKEVEALFSAQGFDYRMSNIADMTKAVTPGYFRVGQSLPGCVIILGERINTSAARLRISGRITGVRSALPRSLSGRFTTEAVAEDERRRFASQLRTNPGLFRQGFVFHAQPKPVAYNRIVEIGTLDGWTPNYQGVRAIGRMPDGTWRCNHKITAVLDTDPVCVMTVSGDTVAVTGAYVFNGRQTFQRDGSSAAEKAATPVTCGRRDIEGVWVRRSDKMRVSIDAVHISGAVGMVVDGYGGKWPRALPKFSGFQQNPGTCTWQSTCNSIRIVGGTVTGEAGARTACVLNLSDDRKVLTAPSNHGVFDRQ